MAIGRPRFWHPPRSDSCVARIRHGFPPPLINDNYFLPVDDNYFCRWAPADEIAAIDVNDYVERPCVRVSSIIGSWGKMTGDLWQYIGTLTLTLVVLVFTDNGVSIQ